MKSLVEQSQIEELKSIILDLFDSSFGKDEHSYITANKTLDALAVIYRIENLLKG